MLPEYFAIVGALIASCGGLHYLYSTIRGRVKPNRVTWFFWGAFPMIAFSAQQVQGVGLIGYATFVGGFTPALVFFASLFNSKAYWRIEKQDYFFASIAFLGLVLWQVTDNPNLALTFALLADLAAAIPTVIKSYKYPETESWFAYGLSAFGFGIAILAINTWTYESSAFVTYLFVINLVPALLAARK